MGNEDQELTSEPFESPLPALEKRVALLETAVRISLNGLIGILQAGEALNVTVRGHKEVMTELEALCEQLRVASTEKGTKAK